MATRARPPLRRVQDDLRARGLPLVLEGSVRRRGLLQRTGPALAGCAVALTAWAVVEHAAGRLAAMLPDSGADPTGSDPAGIGSAGVDAAAGTWVWVMSAGVLVVLAAPLVSWLVALALPHIPRAGRTILGLVAAAATLLAPTAAGVGEQMPMRYRIAVVAAVLAGAYWGLGTILRWVARRSLRELGALGPMVSRVLPLLTLTVLLFFFNAEIWQVAAKLDTARTWGVVAVILGLAVLLTIVNARDELSEIIAGVGAPGSATPPLRRAERLNLLLVTVLVTIMQFMLLALLVFVFFVLFGVLAVPEGTASAWMGERPQRLDGVLAAIPVSAAQLKVCLVLGAFSALQFAATAGTDGAYRSAFVEPVLREVHDGLDVRAEYLRARAQPGAGAPNLAG